jgi:serine/threonine protein kinase
MKGKVWHLALEYCTLGDLKQTLQKGAVPEGAAISLLHELSRALKFLQYKNIIHRDLKPENILLTAQDKTVSLKLADFGLAREIGEDTVLNQTFCGTPLYMVHFYQLVLTLLRLLNCSLAVVKVKKLSYGQSVVSSLKF